MIFVVTEISTGKEVYRYTSDEAIEWGGMEFAGHNHDPAHADPEPGTDAPINAPSAPVMRMTKLDFIDRLGDAAYKAILTMARVDLDVEAFVKRLELATPDPDGASVDLTDPRTVAGVTTLGEILATNGVVSDTWAQGVLNGN